MATLERNELINFDKENVKFLVEEFEGDVYYDASVCPNCGCIAADYESCDQVGDSLYYLLGKEVKIYIDEDENGFSTPFIVDLTADYLCARCDGIQEAKELEAAVDPRFHRERWIHSLDAYRGKCADDISEHFGGFCDLRKDAEVCCTDAAHMAGGVGLLLEGTVTGVFSYDCWSMVDQQSGKRYATRASFINYDEFQPDQNSSYNEAWVKNAQVLEVLVRKDIPTKHSRRWNAAREIATNLGVQIRCFETGEVLYSPVAKDAWEDMPFRAPIWAA